MPKTSFHTISRRGLPRQMDSAEALEFYKQWAKEEEANRRHGSRWSSYPSDALSFHSSHGGKFTGETVQKDSDKSNLENWCMADIS